MPDPFIDLRSDTVTRPTPGMLRAMMDAEVGDDVLGEDPTVLRLQARVAELLGKEAALFVPSGTMSNQIAVKIHTRPGDQLLCDLNCHIYVYEQGGPAALSGVTCRTIDGVNGLLTLDQLADKVQPDNEHLVRTRLVCLENTHNRGGGSIYPLQQLREIGAWARQNDLRMHLDGARLWNAIVATGIAAREWAAPFDTISVCFSKGLGAPIGSALVGSRELIDRARRVRKLLGGGMRQVGNIAAAALYALDHHIERLAEDHLHAQWLAEAIAAVPGLKVNHERVETNMLWMKVNPHWTTGEQIVDALREQGVLILATGRYEVRACTHLDVSTDQAQQAAAIFRRLPTLFARLDEWKMKFAPLHPWNLTPREAVSLQRELAGRLDVGKPLKHCDLIAGADVSHHRFSPIFYAGIVVLRTSDWSIVETKQLVGKSPFPYVPGLLSFRELPIILDTFALLETTPDAVMYDGQGMAHPRRLGIAAHLGLWLNLPTIGCAKSRLCGTFKEPGPNPGNATSLLDKGDVIGKVVRSKSRAKPLFVSVGNHIDLPSCVRWVLKSCRGYRVPEPTRQAHIHVNAFRRQHQLGENPAQ